MTQNRIAVFIFSLFISIADAWSQKTIIMDENESGTNTITCTINGLRLKMYFDTGASSISLSRQVADDLFASGKLTNNDITGTTNVTIANGDSYQAKTVNIRQIDFYGIVLRNVNAIIDENQNASLLFGQSAIRKLGPYQINGNKLILQNAPKMLTKEQERQLLETAESNYENEEYEDALEDFSRLIDESTGDIVYYLYRKATCLYGLKRHEDCVSPCRQVIAAYNNGDIYPNIDYSYLYSMYAFSLYYSEKYEECITGSLRIIRLSDNPDRNCIYYSVIGDCYNELKDYVNAVLYFQKAIESRFATLGKTLQDVRNGKVKDEDLGYYFFEKGRNLYYLGRERESDECSLLSAYCGYQKAIDFCRKYQIGETNQQPTPVQSYQPTIQHTISTPPTKHEDGILQLHEYKDEAAFYAGPVYEYSTTGGLGAQFGINLSLAALELNVIKPTSKIPVIYEAKLGIPLFSIKSINIQPQVGFKSSMKDDDLFISFQVKNEYPVTDNLYLCLTPKYCIDPDCGNNFGGIEATLLFYVTFK